MTQAADSTPPSPANHAWRVLKFGGTSMGDPSLWPTILGQVQQVLAAHEHCLVVCSALDGVTSQLEALASAAASGAEAETLQAGLAVLEQRHRQHAELLDLSWPPECDTLLARAATLLQEPQTLASRAALLASGEQWSSTLLAAWLGAQDGATHGQVRWQDARGLLHSQRAPEGPQDPIYLSTRAVHEPDPELAESLALQAPVHVTQGFVVGGPRGHSLLLGRGGSDTSAACLAARLAARALEIWTDVPGMFSADPRQVEGARLLQRLSYSEAFELASMGARVLHPHAIAPVRDARIPLLIRDTGRPDLPATEIISRSAATEAPVKGIVSRQGVTLFSLEAAAMWQQSGFLARLFGICSQHQLSVDLVSTSESSVTWTLDPGSPVSADTARLAAVSIELRELGELEVIPGCVSISLVGNSIRQSLHRLAPALEVFEDRRIHLMTQSANDLNLTFVVDPEQADGLVRQLHRLLVESVAAQLPSFGPAWSSLVGGEMTQETDTVERYPAWWQAAAPGLLKTLGERDAAYVYALPVVRERARALAGLRSVARVLYSVKANPHPDILRCLAAEGIGFECVSMAEVQRVLDSVPGQAPAGILLTPNFAARAEYREALALGVALTVDNRYPLQHWAEDFRGREIFLRIDTSMGFGHHRKVITAGEGSKFGIALDDLDAVCERVAQNDIRVTGLHVHAGSGILQPGAWAGQLEVFRELVARFPHLRVLDLGGGLGVPERRAQPPLDLAAVDQHLLAARQAPGLEGIDLWLEPGRFLVAEAGVLLARVTQLKTKGTQQFLGLATGMNSLLRPALYGAYHEVANLSRIGQSAQQQYTVVGPICETGDVLGEERWLPESHEGDVILLANTGAYGRVMSSSYNLRSPAEELTLDA